MPLRSKCPGPITTAYWDKVGNMPEYKDLCPIQFMIGSMCCIQEEVNSTVKSHVLGVWETSAARHLRNQLGHFKARHLIIQQEIERGKCSWRRPDTVEKIRIRNTTRVITTKASGTAPQTVKQLT